jgi:hypothetical protein
MLSVHMGIPQKAVECVYTGHVGNYVHAECIVTEHYSRLTDIIYVQFHSPVMQVSGLVFLAYRIA